MFTTSPALNMSLIYSRFVFQSVFNLPLLEMGNPAFYLEFKNLFNMLDEMLDEFESFQNLEKNKEKEKRSC